MTCEKSLPGCDTSSICSIDIGQGDASNPRRRIFLLAAIAGGTALAAGGVAAQAPGPTLTESDPQAVALGYKADATKVDPAKYPQHTAAQKCGVCNFFQGNPTDPLAPCQLFAGKQVPPTGWCAAWAKKA